MRSRSLHSLRFVALVALLACGEAIEAPPAKEAQGIPEAPESSNALEPRLPGDAGSLGPAMSHFTGDTAALESAAKCASCHQDVVATWSTSAHARSSFDNPWYRAAVDAFRGARGAEASRFCGGCHDPALLSVAAMDRPVEPEDPRAHAGITCLVCHSTSDTSADGNGSLFVEVSDALLPDPADAEQIERHRRRMRPDPLGEVRLCGSCHRSFVSEEVGAAHHLNGIEDIGAWRTSAFAGAHARRIDEPVEEATCTSCHMPLVEATHGDLAASPLGRIRSHGVPGAHTALHDDERTRAMLRGAATIDIARVRVDDGWHPTAEALARDTLDGEIAFDVVVRNVRVGHRFPGGTRDLQDTWIELELLDRHGRTVAEAGTRHETRDDPTTFVFRSVLLDAEGRPERLHRVDRFQAPGFDRTLAPRDAMVARFEADLDRARGPFRIEARLRHRRHARDFQRFACESTRTPRGRAFDRTSRALGREPIDACRPEPVVDIAEHAVGEPGDSDAAAGPSRFRRLHDLALALSHSVQERLDEARPVLEQAREAATEPRERAMVDVIGARVAARQGRLDEALAFADRAEANAPDATAAVARVRGEAYAQVWRWQEAAEAFATVAEDAPGDVASWRDLARARGSAGNDRGALEAARGGLAINPRHAELLRSQHLALERLGIDSEGAREAFLRYRAVDEAPALLRRCQRDVEGCNRDRQPVPSIEMRTPRRP